MVRSRPKAKRLLLLLITEIYFHSKTRDLFNQTGDERMKKIREILKHINIRIS
jgi:hypothetical protein